jgi:hypothetical protein
MKSYLTFTLPAIAAAAMIASSAAPALAASTFYGTVVHVSTNNIKVLDRRTRQTLSFEILPRFDRLFSADGKTTYQMRRVKPGQYVGIVYDQRAFGMRHADKIYLLNRANQRIGSQ